MLLGMSQKTYKCPSGWHNAPCSRSALLHFVLPSSCNSLLHLKRSKRKKKGNFYYYTVHFQFCMPNADGFIELFSQVSHLNVMANCKRMPDFHPLGFMQIVEILTYGCEYFMVIIFLSNLSREWGVYHITPLNASLKTPMVEEVKYVCQLM